MPRPSSAPNAAERAATNRKRTVGENIKAHRIARDLSQEELAEKFGVSRAAISQYEIGVGEVNAGNLPRLAHILGVSTWDFFSSPDTYLAPATPSLEWALAQVTRHQGGGGGLKPFSVDLGASAVRSPEATAQAQITAEMLSQFSELSADDQEVVRRLVRSLHEKQPSRRKTRAKRVARRVLKERADEPQGAT